MAIDAHPRPAGRSMPPTVWLVLIAAALAALAPAGRCLAAGGARRPNVILVMTDDQGYGDLGCHGNPIIRTPALDQLHRESVRLVDFHVDPTCSPTRAALMTGRYSCRTGVWHTIMGRSLLRRDEKTMANYFAEAGYRTAIFGKWHLGDNYPYRAMDRGFQESLVHGGGGIGQTPDYWGNTYLNPVLCHNGVWEKANGYCTDVFFDAALRFVDEHRQEPFFLYIAPNVPHWPLQVPETYVRPYLERGVPKELALFYGMITNFDENLGRLLKRIDDLGLAQDTIVVFLTDNGSAGGGYNTQMRGVKGSAYEGGHRVPCFLHWPKRLKKPFDARQLAAHFDLLPTLLDLCNLPQPEGAKFDGASLVPLLAGAEDWAPRTLFVQSHRIENPMPWRQSAVMTEQYRLINGRELYDIQKDPSQTLNIGSQDPKVVDKLRFAYEEWYKDVSQRFGEYCHLVLGSPKQNPTTLTSIDWHGTDVPWNQTMVAARIKANGFWAVEFERPGRYGFALREQPAAARHPLRATVARLKVGEQLLTQAVQPGAAYAVFQATLPAGKTQLQTWLFDPSGEMRGAYYVDVKYLD